MVLKASINAMLERETKKEKNLEVRERVVKRAKALEEERKRKEKEQAENEEDEAMLELEREFFEATTSNCLCLGC